MKILILLGFLLGLFAAPQAQALSCLPAPPPAEEFALAAAVFSGKAVEVKNTQTHMPEDKNLAEFEVYKVWKGVLPARLTVETDGTWGMQFESGQEYLVYLDSVSPYEVALCKFATIELSQATERIEEIEQAGNQAKNPEPVNSEPGAEGKSNFAYLEYGAAVVLLAVAYGLLKAFAK